MAEHDRQIIADQILKAIEYGELPREEIERRLNQIIDDELSSAISDETSMTKVDMCNSLLWRLYTHGEIGYVDRSEESRRGVEKRLQKSKQWQKGIRWGLRTAAIVLVVFIGLTVLNIIPPIRWFSGESTEDEQQYIVVGHQITSDMIEQAIAEHQGDGELTFDQQTELIQYVGFDPGLPDKLDSGLVSYQYRVRITDYHIIIFCIYRPLANPQGNEQVILWKTIYTDISQAYDSYEQDAEGNEVTISGFTVYEYENTGRRNYLWTDDNVVYRLAIQGQIADGEKCVEEIISKEER